MYPLSLSQDGEIYLFLISRSSKIISAIISALSIGAMLAFVSGLSDVAKSKYQDLLIIYFVFMIAVFFARVIFFGKSYKFSVSEIDKVGTVPIVFAFEWIAIFLSMAISYQYFILRADIFYFSACAPTFIFLLLAFIPSAILSYYRFRFHFER